VISLITADMLFMAPLYAREILDHTARTAQRAEVLRGVERSDEANDDADMRR